MKRTLAVLSAVLLSASLFAAAPKTTFNKKAAIHDKGSKTFNAIGAKQTVVNMKTGWNLGNTLEANDEQHLNGGLNTEVIWGQPKTTKEMIDGLASAGFKAIRIPVSWSNHLIDEKYSVDPVWMARVKEIVDWAIAADMYVVLNCHHDNFKANVKMPYGKGYYPTDANKEESEKFLTNVWAQVALAFNNSYDEHLIFETLNEPRLRGTDVEWNYNRNRSESVRAAEIINEFNQIIVDTIRASGGNNKKRCIMVPGYVASPGSALAQDFKMPTDVAPDQLILSVHMYSPYVFAMQSPGTTVFSDQLRQELAQNFVSLEKKFVKNGIPVVVGEYGATNKNNLEERVKWFEFFNMFARKKGMVAILWDNGSYKLTKKGDYNEKYGFYNRRTQEWYFPEILEAIQKGSKDPE